MFNRSQSSDSAVGCHAGVEESTATVKCPTPAPPGECTSAGSRDTMHITLWTFAFFLIYVLLY